MKHEVKGPKPAGFPSRYEECGTRVAAPGYGDVMKEGTESYMSKSQADYMHESKKIAGHMSKSKMV